jgi:hypothetical protein
MEKGINVLNSETTNGLKDTVSRGLKALYRLIGGEKKSKLRVSYIRVGEPTVDGWYIDDPYGDPMMAGPYKTEAAAKGQLTRLLKGYTPASRRPAKG